MLLPAEPMIPISRDTLPHGKEWGYQLKWDGVRLLAAVEKGKVELYSRKLLNKTSIYPEIVHQLQHYKASGSSFSVSKGTYLLDGEAVVFDPVKQRPVFQRILQRERSRRPLQTEPPLFVLFDLLQEGDEDLRPLPYQERHERLTALFPEKHPQLFVTDLFPDGNQLWEWVKENEWEGVVSKKLSSSYKEGKNHQDWFKKKTALVLEVTIVGITIRGGQAASMVMIYESQYLGRVSLGLNMRQRQILLEYGKQYTASSSPFNTKPADLKKETVLWLSKPFQLAVTGLEITSAGLLRHPKMLEFPFSEPAGGQKSST